MGSIHPSTQLDVGVIISDEVTVEEGCRFGAYSIIKGNTHIGPNNIFDPHTVIGAEPQDHKFKGGGKLTIGGGNRFREFVSIHLGHLSVEGTVIGNDNYFFVGSHVAHDCRLGNGNYLGNYTSLAGHVEIGHYSNISGYSGVHQFCKIGDHVMAGGGSGIRRDIPPYTLVYGDPACVLGINHVGLSRKGWTKDQLRDLKEAYRLFRKNQTSETEQVNFYHQQILEFKESSERGLVKFGGQKR